MDEETKRDFVETYDDLDKIEEIHEYFEKYEDQSDWDEQELEYLTEMALKKGLEEGIAQGIAQGISQGISQGSIQEKYEIAKKMINEKSTNEFISKITGLEISEIEKLKS